MKPRKSLKEFFSFYFGLAGFATGCIPLCVISAILSFKPSNVVGNTVSSLGPKVLPPALGSIAPLAGFLISESKILDDEEEVDTETYKPPKFNYFIENSYKQQESLLNSIKMNNMFPETPKVDDSLQREIEKRTRDQESLLNSINKPLNTYNNYIKHLYWRINPSFSSSMGVSTLSLYISF